MFPLSLGCIVTSVLQDIDRSPCLEMRDISKNELNTLRYPSASFTEHLSISTMILFFIYFIICEIDRIYKYCTQYDTNRGLFLCVYPVGL